MGKKRITTVDTEKGLKEKKEAKEKEQKKVRIPGLKGGERVVAMEAGPEPEQEKEKEEKKKLKKKTLKPPRVRGKKYKAAKTKVDPEKVYPLSEAIKLVKTTSITSFDGSVEVHLKVVDGKIKGEVELPHFKAKEKKVKVADEDIVKNLEEGKIDFDVLLATPEFMPKLAKYARILGPKGLMPNPKAGTIVKDPQKAMEKFKKPALAFRTENDQPLIHTVIGKVSQNQKELEENFKALVEAVGVKRIKKAVLTSTMGPGVKVDINLSI